MGPPPAQSRSDQCPRTVQVCKCTCANCNVDCGIHNAQLASFLLPGSSLSHTASSLDFGPAPGNGVFLGTVYYSREGEYNQASRLLPLSATRSYRRSTVIYPHLTRLTCLLLLTTYDLKPINMSNQPSSVCKPAAAGS